MDPVQVIFLKEERIKGSSQEKRNINECVRDSHNMEAGTEKGQGTEMDTEVQMGRTDTRQGSRC